MVSFCLLVTLTIVALVGLKLNGRSLSGNKGVSADINYAPAVVISENNAKMTPPEWEMITNTTGTDVFEDDTLLSYNPDTKTGYMNNCLFLGDSRTVAMVSYGAVSDKNVLAKLGVCHTQVLDMTFTQNSGKQYTIESFLESHDEPVIYVGYGVNGMNYITVEEYEKAYREVIDKIISYAGDNRHVVIMSIWPVDDNGRYAGSVKNEWIDEYNKFLYGLAKEKGIYYLDIKSILKDEDGSMLRKYDAGDGLHYSTKAYKDIIDYVIHHPVPGVSDEGEFVVEYVAPKGEYKYMIDNVSGTPAETPVPATPDNTRQNDNAALTNNVLPTTEKSESEENKEPTQVPTIAPTLAPTEAPTQIPTETVKPTEAPKPTTEPTGEEPTPEPTKPPQDKPEDKPEDNSEDKPEDKQEDKPQDIPVQNEDLLDCNNMIPGSKGHADSSCLHVRGCMHLYDPPKHEKVAIFCRKMSGF